MSSSFTGSESNFLPESYIFPEDNDEEYDVKLRQYLNNIASAVNTKDSGLYTDEEVITGQQFIPTYSTDTGGNVNYRNVFRKVIDFGSLPNTGSKLVPYWSIFGGAAMFRVSKLTDYATVVMTCLARAPDAVLSAQGIARRTGVELPTTSKVLKSMVYVRPAGFNSDEKLRAWVDQAIAYVKTLPAK